MAWNPDLTEFTELGRIPGDLLNFALKKFKELTKQNIEVILEDENGVFGYNMERAVLTAKSYIFGDLVSCHKRAVVSAINTQKRLVMFIGNNKTFYSFNPDEIFNFAKENIRAGSLMLNFPIKLGVKLFRVSEEKEDEKLG